MLAIALVKVVCDNANFDEKKKQKIKKKYSMKKKILEF